MDLYYSTYGMQGVDVFEALPRLRDMGYRGMEIAVQPGWQTEPARMDPGARRRLAADFRSVGFPTPVIMALLRPCAEGEGRPAALAQFEASFALARDLRIDDAPLVVSSTLGHERPWESGKEAIAGMVVEVADMAARYGAVLAIEPHAGGDFETPEKAVWLIERAAHEQLRLNFDYSHFLVEGLDLKHSADLNVPLAAHNHIKDGYKDAEGRVAYLLPGDGALDLEEYVRVVKAAGWDRYICPEVTGQIWSKEGYDPWAAAQFCFDALDPALHAAD